MNIKIQTLTGFYRMLNEKGKEDMLNFMLASAERLGRTHAGPYAALCNVLGVPEKEINKEVYEEGMNSLRENPYLHMPWFWERNNTREGIVENPVGLVMEIFEGEVVKELQERRGHLFNN